jgi:hypothetical protein
VGRKTTKERERKKERDREREKKGGIYKHICI